MPPFNMYGHTWGTNQSVLIRGMASLISGVEFELRIKGGGGDSYCIVKGIFQIGLNTEAKQH